MKLRPFQIIVMAIFAALAIGGVVVFATFKGFGLSGKPVGAITIWGTLPTDAVQAEIDDLKRNQQEFAKVTYVERDPATFDTDLADAIASGNAPDLIITNQERLMNERNKLEVIPFSSISERSFKDNFLSIDELYLADNGEYAIPYVVDPMVLFYNRANLATIGVGQVPTSWEVILGLTPQLTKRTNANVILKSAIAFGTYDNIPNARGIVSLLLLQAGNKIAQVGAQGLRTTLSAGSDEFSRSPGESAIAFYTQFADPAKVVYSWNRSLSDARQSFIAGDSTFYVGYASERQLLSQANPNLNFDMTLVPQPQTSSVHIDYALAYAFAIPKGSPNSQGAFRTAEALASNPEIVITTQRLGVASALRSQPMAQGDIYAPIVNAAALTAAGWLSPAPGVTDRIFSSMINSIISGQATIHDALVTADESFSASY